MALHLLGYALDHPVMRAGLRRARRLHRSRGTRTAPARRLEACQSPVWDTALAVIALADAGLPPDDPALVTRRATGCWTRRSAARRLGGAPAGRSPPGGWAFEFDNDNYPDIDDTAEVVLALRRVGHPDAERAAAIDRGRAPGLLGMQSHGRRLGRLRRRQHPRAASTSCRSATSARSSTRRAPTSPRTSSRRSPPRGWPASRPRAAASTGCCGAQEPDGSWFGRWGANYVYGTGAVVPALVAAGRAGRASRRSAAPCAWLEQHQNADGGWGEDLRSYDDQALERPGRVHRVADRVGAARPARRRGARDRRDRARHPLAGARRSGTTAPGTSR